MSKILWDSTDNGLIIKKTDEYSNIKRNKIEGTPILKLAMVKS